MAYDPATIKQRLLTYADAEEALGEYTFAQTLREAVERIEALEGYVLEAQKECEEMEASRDYWHNQSL